MRGVMIKMTSYVKRQRNQQTENLLRSRDHNDRLIKANSFPQLFLALNQDWQHLRHLLLFKCEKNLRFLKANHYGLGNKAGKRLAEKSQSNVLVRILMKLPTQLLTVNLPSFMT